MTFQMTDYSNWHDNVESWWCGKNLKYEFCDNVDGDCGGNLGQTGAGNIKTGTMGHPNIIDRVKLQYYDPLEIGAVTAFTGDDCHGWAGRLDATADPALTSYYNRADLEARHLVNDQISSVAIPQGYSLKMYRDDGLVESNSKVLNGEPWFDKEHTMKCINLKDHAWDDMVSSAAVYRTNGGAYAQGRWIPTTATEGIDIVYHVGMSSSNSQATKESMTYSLTADMSMGIEFYGFSASAGISKSYENSVVVDTKSEFNTSIDFEYHIKCTGGVGSEGGVGLWQFVVSNSDGSV